MTNKQLTYELNGLTCANCAAKFEKNLKELPNVSNASVNFTASKVTIDNHISVDQIEQAGAFDGISVKKTNESTVKNDHSNRSFWKNRQNIEAFIAFLLLVAGIFSHFYLGASHPLTISVLILSATIGGYDLFITGVKHLLAFHFDMKTLMTIAIIGAILIGEWIEGAVVVLLFAISEALEAYSVDKARNSIQTLMDIAPSEATILKNNIPTVLPVEEIQIDDIMIIKPGEKIAMDGVVISGKSTVNQAAITGESMPVAKNITDEVFAGTLNEEGFIEVKVTKVVEDTTLAKIIHLVEDAQTKKAPAQLFVDKFATYYTPTIMVLALLVATVPPLVFSMDWSKWIYLGLATLVVGCPCALIISTPVAIVTAIGNAAKNGVLIKGGIHLEEAGRLKAIAFDKTGTLTIGKPSVTTIVPIGDYSQNEIVEIAMTIEQYSQHPIASAVMAKAQELSLDPHQGENFQSFTGKGAKVDIHGKSFYIGNERLFAELNKKSVPDYIKEQMHQFEAKGQTVMLVGMKQSIIGIIAVADQIRPTSQSIIKQLYQLGIKKTMMLTGDNETTAGAIANEIHMTNYKANLLPEDKLNVINEFQKDNHRIAMVGDGVNDAPALASATVGIAMGGSGTDTALETADIALMADDLRKLPYTIALSRKALNIIKQNISFSLGLKIIALLLVIPGWLTLWIAIIADVGATLLVVLNSMRLMGFKH